MESQTQLKQAVTAVRAGHKAEARQLLKQILQASPNHEQAWLWTSAVMETDAKRIQCLRRVLAINPDNTAAQKGLAQLQSSAPSRQPLAMPKPGQEPVSSPPTMSCPQCGVMNRQSAQFCKACGQTLSKHPKEHAASCPQCGATASGGYRYCHKCGGALDDKPTAQPSAKPVPQNTPAMPEAAPSLVQKAAIQAAAPVPAASQQDRPRQAEPAAPRPMPPVPVAQKKQPRPAAPGAIFCVACGTENTPSARSCVQCRERITIPSPAIVQRLIDVVENSPSEDKRLEAIRTLGRLQARAAIPLLLEIANIRGFKRSNEQHAARLAIVQIVDWAKGVITCSTCDAANPTSARYCHNCGIKVSPPAASPQEIEQLISLIGNNPQEPPLQAIEKLGQLGAQAATPALLDLFTKLGRGLTVRIEQLLVLEALVNIGDSEVPSKLVKLANQYRGGPLCIISAACVQALIRLNKRDLAIQQLKSLSAPDQEDENGRNLPFVLLLGQIGSAEAVPLLCRNIMAEKKRWNPGIGYSISFFDPIALLVTASLSVAYNVLGRAIIDSQGKQASASMITPNYFDLFELGDSPGHVRKMVALHCYNAALANIASRDPAPVKAELDVREKPLERAVIGLALAQNGDPSVENVLQQLQSDSDWAVRLLAYEGLVVLADTMGKTPKDQLAALRDHDIRVRTAVARVMISTGDETYTPHVLALADSADKKQRRAVLPIIALLATAGCQSAIARLKALVQSDSDHKVREGAQAILHEVKEVELE